MSRFLLLTFLIYIVSSLVMQAQIAVLDEDTLATKPLFVESLDLGGENPVVSTRSSINAPEQVIDGAAWNFYWWITRNSNDDKQPLVRTNYTLIDPVVLRGDSTSSTEYYYVDGVPISELSIKTDPGGSSRVTDTFDAYLVKKEKLFSLIFQSQKAN